MIDEFLHGIGYFRRGIGLIRQPELRPFVAIPLLCNILIFSLLTYFVLHLGSNLSDWLNTFLPNWLHWLSWLIYPLLLLLELLVMIYTFTALANLIASPFNSLLSEKVQQLLGGQLDASTTSWRHILRDSGLSVLRACQMLLYYFPRMLLFLFFFIVPIVHLFAAPLWFGFNGWMMAVQYLDCPADNNRIKFQAMRQKLLDHKAVCFGFGCSVMVASLIPIVNFFVVPTAIAGATALWHEQIQDPLQKA